MEEVHNRELWNAGIRRADPKQEMGQKPGRRRCYLALKKYLSAQTRSLQLGSI